MQIGDFVKGLPGSPYSVTTEYMTRGVITKIPSEGTITIKVLEQTENRGLGNTYDVAAKCFEVTGHQKPFNRAEVLGLLRNGCKKAVLDYDLRSANLRRADLSGANLSGADLRSADLDFSCLPLKCGGLKWKIDKRLACQLAYHLCSMQCDDTEYIAVRNALLPFANQFHRVGECGRLGPVEIKGA